MINTEQGILNIFEQQTELPSSRMFLTISLLPSSHNMPLFDIKISVTRRIKWPI